MNSFPENPLKIGLCQMTSTDDLKANRDQMFSLLNQALEFGPQDIVCFPENSLYIYVSKKTPILQLDLQDSIFKELQEFADKNDLHLLLGSVPIKEGGVAYNSTLLVSPSKKKPQVVYRKIHLFDVDVEGHPPVRESDYYRHGDKTSMIDINGWKIGLSICYDLRFSELYLEYVRQGAHILMVPSAFTVPTGKAHWHTLLKARAIESQCFVLAAAQSGRHVSKTGAIRETFGHSLAIDPWGKTLAEILDDGPGCVQVGLDPKSLVKVKTQIPMQDHRRLGLKST